MDRSIYQILKIKEKKYFEMHILLTSFTLTDNSKHQKGKKNVLNNKTNLKAINNK
jgi:hypothetical protein